MAPPRLYEMPLEQLERLLRVARTRGLSFDDAWDEAVRPGRSIVMTNAPRPPAGAIRWPTDRADRLAWQDAVRATRGGWRRAYEQMPMSTRERALASLGDSFARLDAQALRAVVAGGMPAGDAIPSAA